MLLADIQRDFLKAVANLDTSSELSEEIISPKISLQNVLGIYRNNYRLALLSALKQVYIACLSLVGEKFPIFLERENLLPSLPYIADVAKLEWLIYQVLIGDKESATLSSYYGVDEIWDFCQPEKEQERLVFSQGFIKIIIWQDENYSLRINRS